MGVCTELRSGWWGRWESGSESEGSESESENSDSESGSETSDSESGSDSEVELDLYKLSLYDGREGRPERQEMAMASSNNRFWKPGKVLRIRFIKGNKKFRSKVEKFAKTWEKYANIKFKFVSEGHSHIRISFDQSGGCHSMIGTCALGISKKKATMNLAVSESTSRRKFRSHVLHEFGHVLGCIHEHCSPAGGIQWKRKAVFKYYRDKYNWDEDKVEDNVLKKYREGTVTQFSKFDPHSIMLYRIPSKLTENGFSTRRNTTLSETDKKFIAKIYPKVSTRRH
ncbi:unnamed protein product [Calypogeia fissa]